MKNMRNSVQIIGNVGNAPEIREFENGKLSARFNVATNENFKNAAGEWVQNTSWHKVVAWGGMANYIAKHITKGGEVALEGKLNNRSFEGKDGITRFITEIVVNEVMMVSGKNSKKGEEELSLQN